MKKFLLYSKLKFALMILLKLIYAASFVGFSLVLQWLVNLVTAEGTTNAAFLKGVGFCIGYTILVVGIMLLKDRFTMVYVNHAVGKLREHLSDKILNIRYCDYAENDSALYLSRLTNDMKTISLNYFSSLLVMPDQIFTFIFAVAVAFYINYAIALVMLGLTFLILIVPLVFNKPLNRANIEVSEKIKQYTQILKQTFLGMDVVKNFNAQDEMGAIIQKANQQLTKKNTFLETMNVFAMDVGILIVVLLQLGSIAVAGYLYLQHILLIGAVIAVVQLSGNMYEPLMNIAGKIALISGVKELNKTVLHILDTQEESPVGELPAGDDIVVQDIRYSYSDGQEILKGVSAAFESGKKYLIVGKSGSGKSTLLKLIGKMYDGYSGDILLGGANYREITEKQLFERLSIAQQASYVFERSVRENIDFKGTGHMEQLEQAVEMAELEQFVLENGLDNVIDEEVNKISGGEKQRIGLARALYRDRRILLLDEITSSLDKSTAHKVEQNILRLQNKTVIHVSHKLFEDLVEQYDRVMIMEDGVIKAFDTPENIVHTERFRQYTNTQVS